MSTVADPRTPSSREIARVAHELTTPVSLIWGSLENLQESVASLLRYVEATEKYVGDAEEITRLRTDLRLEHRLRDTPGLLEICTEGARRLTHVVTQMRSNRSGALDSMGARADLRAIIDTAVVMASHGRLRRPLVVVDCTPKRLDTNVNAQSLGQVLLNVIRNAFDALEGQADGRVDIEARLCRPKGLCESAASRTIICVRDNGPGIPANRRERVFEEGVSSRADRGGLGLGLAISRELMAELGGRLDLVASADGAEFVIEVPAVEGCDSTAPV